MSLTREQALAAAWLALAFDAAAAAPPGGTIAQAAAAQASSAGAAALHKGSAAPKKVATAPGSVKYHAPIGALIIPHGAKPGGGEHFVHGQPSHMIHSTSEAKWIANQWKDKDKASGEAEKAVAAGTHHWVQAGQHSYAVHNSLEVHVPKDTDIHDEAAVKHAPKVIVKHGPQPEHVMLHGDGSAGEVNQTEPGQKHLLEQGYKKLPDQPAKKSVTFAGKHAAWVPHDWQVHKEADQAEDKLAGKYAKDPAGHWHLITKSGAVHDVPGYNASAMEDWASKGGIVPEDSHPGPEPEHVAPNQAAEGHEPPKAEVGGVAVTKDQIHDAIAKLQSSPSTQIKGLLKGHPLEASDYHSVFKAELEAHPELKIPSGTKKQHASPAKLAFIHHLAGQAEKLAQDEAQAAAAKQAKEKAEAAAAHAQQLTPGTYEVGGVHVTAEEIQAALAKLQGSKSTQIKGLLKGNPLAGSDYWKVVNDYNAAHGLGAKAKGTKQAHVPNAKLAFIAALQELSGKAATGEVQSGHDTAAELDSLVSGSQVKKGWDQSADGAIARALKDAHEHGQPFYVFLTHEPGVWTSDTIPPEGKAYFEATPEHQVAMHLTDGETNPWSAPHVLDVAKAWLYSGGAAEPEPKAPEPAAPEPEPVPKPLLDTAAWKQTPEYQAVHDLIVNHPPGLPPHDNKLDTNQQLAAALYLAGKAHQTRYLFPAKNGDWTYSSGLPSGVAGSFGVPGKAYYEISPDHEIVAYGTDGQGTALPGETVKEIAEKWLTPPPEPEKPPEPAKPEPDIPVMVGGEKKGTVPAGSKFYKISEPHTEAAKASVYVKKPDGAWTWYGLDDTIQYPPAYTEKHDNLIASGELKEATGFESAKPEPGGFDVTADGNTLHVPAGSQVYVSQHHPEVEPGSDWADIKYVKEPDGSWQYVQKTDAGPMVPGAGHTLNAEVKSGHLVPWPPEKPAEPEPPKPEPAKPEPSPSPDIAQLKTLLINGAVKPTSEVEGGKSSADWALATVLRIAAKTGNEKWLVKQPYGNIWKSQTFQPHTAPDDTSTEYYYISSDLAVMHHAGGQDTTLAMEQVAALVHQMVVPDSVKVQHPVTGDYQMFHHGFYYKPSKGAKAYLEIKPWAPGAKSAGATFIYHAPSGDKEVNASYAAKVLTDATEYHAQAKDAPNLAAKKASYATVAKPGSYQIWSSVEHGPSDQHSAEIHADGSVTLHQPNSSMPLPAETEHGKAIDALVEGGSLLDPYGTSVVQPGVKTAKYHIFGSEAKTPEQVKELLAKFEQNYGDVKGLSHLLQEFPDKKLLAKFAAEKIAGAAWQAQRDALMGLLRELLQVPEQPPGTAAGPPEAKFLKGLPPGIHSSQDVFTWTPKGYAKPSVFEFSAHDTSTELGAKIKEVGAQFGGGKVVGTHPSALGKDQKVAWLKAWQAGNMTAVFALDAMGGKVSPVHPGAPDNAATHHVTWAPWDESQIPAGQAIEGDWSPEGVMAPKAEVDNFLIKAGLQHAAWLTTTERRQWMQAHRGNDQLKVDKLSKQAADAFNSGAEPKSEPPKWTDDLGPAGPFDAFLDEKTPAHEWPAATVDAFLAVHKAEMEPFAQQAATAQGYGSYSVDELLNSSSYYAGPMKKSAVQFYLDDLAAKEAAEKLKPKYHLAEPGIAEDQFGRQYQFITGTPAELARRSVVAALARAWGFRTPQVTQMALEDGTAGAAAPLLAHEGTLAHLPAGIAGLTDRELGDVAREHVLDYALANPGSTPGSYLRVSDGSIVGADKSSALSDLGWQGTDPAQMSAQVTQPVSLIFSAIADGSLSQDQAAAAYTAAIRAARRMAALSDSRLQQFADQAGLVTAGHDLIARKNALPDTIKAMWDGVFAQKGWTPPEVPAAKLSRGLRSGFSEPEFMDHVAAAKSFGVPAFFAEPGLANGHVLVWTELSPGGQRMVRGEAAVRGHVLDKVTGWVKAHSGESATMVPKGEAELHQAIKTAAEVINTHASDQLWDGPITSAALAGMVSAKSKLITMEADAQHALAAGPSSPAYQAVASDHGDPAAVVSMAQFYLAQVDTAEHAKVSGQGGLTPEQFPAWKPTEETHVLGGGVKITYTKSKRDLGTNSSDVTEDTWSLGKDDGELHLAAGKSASYPGYVWRVELPTGELIEINDSGETQTPKAHTGMVRFTSVTSDGSASLERVRAFLQQAGLPMEEASQADMENLYWRTMAWVLSDRADRKDPAHLKVWDEIAQGLFGKNAGQATGPGKEAKHLGELPAKVIQQHMAPEEEALLWRKAWAHLTSPAQVQQWVDNEGFLPHLGHHDIHAPEVPGGKPDWFRFDVPPEQAAAQQLVTESFSDSGKDAVLVARSGGLFSSDARLRALGTHKTGMSWGSDMTHGSSGTVFTRQNQQSQSHPGAWISPRVLARVQTYTFESDHFGETDARRTHAYFNFAKASAHSMSGNEAMVMDAISLLDDIEVLKAYSESQRQQIIADLKGAGITMIRGLPVEDRIVTSSGVHAAVQKAIAAAKADGWFAQPENPYVPPPSALSGAPAAEKKFAQKVGAQEKLADAAAQAAKVAQQLEELAQGAEVPFTHAA